MTGAPVTMLAFFLYCALEGTTGLWASSFLVLRHNIAAESAASMASLFYIGITAGRFLSGFISDKLGDRRMVSIGIVCVLFGTVLLFVPVEFSSGSAVRPFTLGFCIKRPCVSAPKTRRRSWVCRWRAPMSAA